MYTGSFLVYSEIMLVLFCFSYGVIVISFNMEVLKIQIFTGSFMTPLVRLRILLVHNNGRFIVVVY